MHADAVKGGLKAALDPPHEIVCVQNGVLRRLGDALSAQGEQIGQGPDHHQEVPREGADLEMARLVHQGGMGQELLEKGLAAHGAGAGTASAVRRGEGLVQVHVDAVKAHVAGAHHAHDGVEIGPVIVAEAAGLVDQAGDLQDVLIEEAHGVGIGEHEPRGVLPQDRLQGLQVHAAVRGGGDVHHLVAAHGGGGGVGAVGGIGHDDLAALRIAPAGVILLDEQHAGKLPVGAGGGLEGHALHAGDLAEIFRRGVQHLPAAGGVLLPGQGMDAGEARQGGHVLIDAGIVLHGAGAQGVEAAVHAVDPVVELGIVPGQIHLAEFRQRRGGLAAESLGQLNLFHVAFRQQVAVPAGNALFKNQLHFASTSLTRAMALSSSALLCFSVAHQRTPPSTGRPPRTPFCSRAASTSSCRGRLVTNSWKKGPG